MSSDLPEPAEAVTDADEWLRQRFGVVRGHPEWRALVEAFNAGRAAPAAPAAAPAQAEPVAWQWRRKGEPWSLDKTLNSQVYAKTPNSEVRPLYAAPAAPAGWQWVPVEPTPEMRDAAVKAICYGPEGGFTRIAGPDRCWSAMLAAAPGAQGDAS